MFLSVELAKSDMLPALDARKTCEYEDVYQQVSDGPQEGVRCTQLCERCGCA